MLTFHLAWLDTLIVWTEPDGTEIALSFQDPAACANICEFIGEVQTHLTLVHGRAFCAYGSSPSNERSTIRICRCNR